MLAGDLADRIAHVAGIQAQILLVLPTCDFRPRNHDLSQSPVQQFGVVQICAADGDRQRDPTGVDQQASFAALFSPDPSGSDLRIRSLTEPCPWFRRRPATARQYGASRHIQRGQPATASGKSRPYTSSESVDAPRSRHQTRGVRLSTECRFAEHK